MKKPYIKKYSKVSRFNVWIVDGKYIRKNIDKEFTNFGQHYRFDFIPKSEFWIDRNYGESVGEENYFIKNMLVQNKLMRKGVSYSDAIDEATRIEMEERKKDEFFSQFVGVDKEELLSRVKKRILKSYSKKVNVWIVNGKIVRDLFFVHFTQGGHDKVFSFIPDNEIWIDDSVSAKERKLILLHELHERNLLPEKVYSRDDINSLYENYSVYETAHFPSAELEHYCRHNPQELDIKLKEEIRRS